jgi:hypothetical protein
LLERDINKRLGCRGAGGMESIKSHPWMRGIDWIKLERKEIEPPFVPDVSLFQSPDKPVELRDNNSDGLYFF